MCLPEAWSAPAGVCVFLAQSALFLVISQKENERKKAKRGTGHTHAHAHNHKTQREGLVQRALNSWPKMRRGLTAGVTIRKGLNTVALDDAGALELLVHVWLLEKTAQVFVTQGVIGERICQKERPPPQKKKTTTARVVLLRRQLKTMCACVRVYALVCLCVSVCM